MALFLATPAGTHCACPEVPSKTAVFLDPCFGPFFQVVYSFEVSVQIDPDLVKCITPQLQYAALAKEKVCPAPAAIAVRRTY